MHGHSADEVLRRYAALPVPRYTSYPTAADFSDDTGARDHAAWLRRLDDGADVSVYLHVPYCRELCFYCGCHAKAVRRDTVVAAYRDALLAEIALVARQFPGRGRIRRLHWGGGTPSMLGPDGLSAVCAALRAGFDIDPEAEHAIELDPRHVDAALAQHLAAIGVNRASLGVQDVEPAVQAAIGRVQPLSVVQAAVGHLRAAGIVRINCDLIYGLPLQTTESLERTCDAVAALDPGRIACFGYAHLPARRANQRLIDAARLPDADARFAQAQAVADALRRRGFEPVGLDHFARPTDGLAVAAREYRLRRNFQGYTDDDTAVLLGFGASAISRFPDGYVQNAAEIGQYRVALGEGRLASRRGRRVGEAERVRARIIEELVCHFRVDLKQFGAGADFGDEMALLRPMVADGLLVLRDSVVAMTALGRPVVRVAASIFDAFRRDRCGAFSPAV